MKTYFENFIVIEPGLTGLQNQLLGEEEGIKYQDQYGKHTAGIGAEAILEI